MQAGASGMRRSTITAADARERGRGWRTIRQVTPYLWPSAPGQEWVKRRVVLALCALVVAKLISVSTPFLYKAAVDSLAGETRDDGWLLALGAIALTVAYGVARISTVGFGELRDALFVRVGQRALRQLALETFTHIHRLSMRYHITRKTGGLSRIIERGVKGVDFLLRFMLFSVGPLILELTMVAILFAVLFDWRYAAVVVVTIWAYVTFTFKLTEWRVKIRRQMNEADTEANQKAIDSLLNFETVKYFGAETREAARYDASMEGYRPKSCRAELRAGADHYHRPCHRDGDGGDRGAAGHADGGRFCHGAGLHDPDHHAAWLSGHRLPRDPSGTGGYGRNV